MDDEYIFERKRHYKLVEYQKEMIDHFESIPYEQQKILLNSLYGITGKYIPKPINEIRKEKLKNIFGNDI